MNFPTKAKRVAVGTVAAAAVGAGVVFGTLNANAASVIPGGQFKTGPACEEKAAELRIAGDGEGGLLYSSVYCDLLTDIPEGGGVAEVWWQLYMVTN